MTVRVRALATSLLVIGAVLLVPGTAWACSCSTRDVEDSLAAGYTVAVVTRTDPGSSGTYRANEAATFRVEGSIGPAVPVRLTAVLDWCTHDFPWPGGVGALVFQPRRTVPTGELSGVDPGPGDPADRVLGECPSADVGEALRRIQGEPATPGKGGAVALVWGPNGRGSWLAALDARGRVRAWHENDGFIGGAGACPGGAVAVAVGTVQRSGVEVDALTVHDLATLRILRTITLELDGGVAAPEVRCSDPQGTAVEVLAFCCGTSAARLVRVRGKEVTWSPLAAVQRAVPVADGFVALQGNQIVHLAPDGARKELARVPYAENVTASPDGRTIGVAGAGLQTLDGRTGRRLARWAPPEGIGVDLVGWTPRGLLAVTSPLAADYPLRLPEVIEFDAALRPVARRAGAPMGWRSVVGDALVTFKQGRLAVTPLSGPIVEADELMLARAQGVAGVPGRAFNPAAVEPRPLRTPVRVAYDGAAQPGPGAGVLALGALAAASVAWIVWRARPRR